MMPLKGEKGPKLDNSLLDFGQKTNGHKTEDKMPRVQYK